MSSAAELHSQIASIMEVLANSAVAEICKAVEDGYAVVNLEMSRSLKENECLRRRVRLLELQVSRYRAEQRLKLPQEGATSGRAFPGVRLLHHRTGRDTPTGTGSILQNRSRFLNKSSASQPQQKTTPMDLDQDPDQEVVTTTKAEPTETEEDSDLVIVKVEGSVSIEEPNVSNNTTNNLANHHSLPAPAATQTSILKEEQEIQGKPASFWKPEEKEEGDFQTSPHNDKEPSPFIPDWKHFDLKQEQPSNSAYPLPDFSNEPNSNQFATNTSFTSPHVGPSEVYASSHCIFGQEDFTPASLTGENMRYEREGNQMASLQDPTLFPELTNQATLQTIDKISNKIPNPHYTCILCHQQFNHKIQLRCHERSHKAEKPYACDQCGRVFHIFGHLKRHRQVHTGERPHLCAMCGKRFSTANNLKVHQSVHTGERKFKCTTCGKSYPFHSSLIRHQAIHEK